MLPKRVKESRRWKHPWRQPQYLLIRCCDQVASKTEGHIQHVAGQQSYVRALAYLKVHQGKSCILIAAGPLTKQMRRVFARRRG